MKILLKIIPIYFLLLILFNFNINFSHADCCNSADLDTTLCTPCLTNPLTGTAEGTDINKLIGKVINAVLGIVGSLALVMFIYGGLAWMTAAGSNERVQKGKDILIWATLGLITIFTSYALVKLVLKSLGG